MKKYFTGCLVLALCWGKTPLVSQTLSGPVARLHEPGRQTGKIALKEALARLESRFHVSIMYDSKLVQNKKVEVLTQTAATISEELDRLLRNSGLYYDRISDTFFVILTKEDNKKGQRREKNDRSADEAKDVLLNQTRPDVMSRVERISSSLTTPVEFTVTGKVTDDKGEGLPGVNVLLKGTTTGTATDANGKYSLTIPDGTGTLVFSSIGYIGEETPVNSRSVVDISLVPDIESLEEVVVVGYGAQKKSQLTGSISRISGDKIKDVPAVSMDQLIQGRAAGVQVSQANGQPGGSISIRIRGNGSFRGGNEPLYVIDGIPVDNDASRHTSPGTNFGSQGNALATLNPTDIASIEILKDASAAAIYGSRGANGVVLITTKRGQAGKNSLTFDAYYGVSEIRKQYDMLHTDQFLSYLNTSFDNAKAAGLSASLPNVYPNRDNWVFPGTDWQKELYRAAPMQNYNLGLSGGSERFQYAISGGYFNQVGTMLGTDLKRYSFRVNLDSKITNRLKIGNSLSVSYTDDNQLPTETSFGLVTYALQMQPGIPVRDGSGNFGGHIGAGANNLPINPIGNATEWIYNNRRLRTLGNIFAELELLKGLTFKSSLGIDYLTANITHFQTKFKWGEQTRPSRGQNSVNSSANWIWENYLTFNRTFGEHSLTVLAGTSTQYVKSDYLLASRENFTQNSIPYLTAGPDLGQIGLSGASHYSFLSYYGRVNYAFKNKYLLTATMRADGSSKFGPSNKWGTFPSVSAGWNIMEESFMPQINGLDNLKLKVGYGRTGNSEIDAYSYLSNLNRSSYVEGNAQVNAVFPRNIPNPAVRWESVEQYNAGLEVGLLKNRINVETDFYIKNTLNNLMQRPYAPSDLGNFAAPFENIGKIANRGFELAINTVNTTGPLRWTSDLNFSLNRNEFVSSGTRSTQEIIQDRFISRVGGPIGMFYGYVADGHCHWDHPEWHGEWKCRYYSRSSYSNKSWSG